MLSDTEFYKKESYDRNKEFAEKIRDNVNNTNDYITDKEKKFILKILRILGHRYSMGYQRSIKYSAKYR